jgi:AAA domain
MDETSFHQNEPVNPKQWRRLTSQQRNTLIDQISVTYGRLNELSCALTALDAATRSKDNSGRRVVQGLAIVGPPKTGKTLLARRWIAAQCAVIPAGEDIPHVFVDLPRLMTPKGIAVRCLAELGDPSANRGTIFSMEQRMKVLLRTSATRLLVVDQLERLIEDERPCVLSTCVDLLKRMTQDAGVSAVFLGEQGVAESILSMCPPLERLVGEPRLLSPFEWDERKPQTVEEFRTLMRAIDEKLPLDDSELDEEDMAYRIWYATSGTLGWIMALIRRAAKRAITGHIATLNRYLLAEAYDACIASAPMGHGKANPFSR